MTIQKLSINRLYIFGAGASYNASESNNKYKFKTTPLDKDFSKRIKEFKCSKPLWVQPTIKNILKNWDDKKEFTLCGLEEIVLRQLSHMDFHSTIHSRGKPLKYTQTRYLTDIVHIIAFILKKAKENRKQLYKRFSDVVFKKPIERVYDRIISFNYDVLLDEYLISNYDKHAIYFDRILDNPSGNERDRRQYRYKSSLMLKLHGSLNWQLPLNQFDKILSKNSDTEVWLEKVFYSNKPIDSPSSKYAPCIIPPVPSKPITNLSLFKSIWKKAYQYLCDCKALIIIGYSLPMTDSVAISLFSQFKNRRLQKVIIVDPDPTVVKKWKELIGSHRLRIDNITQEKRPLTWQYFESFEEYVQDLEAEQKRKSQKKKKSKKNSSRDNNMPLPTEHISMQVSNNDP